MAGKEKRIHISLAEKKKYAQILVKAPKRKDGRKTVIELYRKKNDGEDMPQSTFSSLYRDRFKILESKSKHKFQLLQKKSSSMLKLEKKIMEEYPKRQMKMKLRGVAKWLRKLIDENFADDEESQELSLSIRFVTRVIRELMKHKPRPRGRFKKSPKFK